MIESRDYWWLYWCRGLTLERWRCECRLVEERFSLFRSFAETPFLGFRGVVARAGCEYRLSVAAEMDFYPKYLPWAFVTPSIAGARADGKLSIDLPWYEVSSFADVIGVVIGHIEEVHQKASGAA